MVRRAREIYQEQRSPTIVRETLEGQFEYAPHVNTIKAWVRDLRGDDPTPLWSIAARDHDPDVDPALVMPVLAYLAHSGAEVRWVSVWEAQVITRLRSAYPLGPKDALRLARELIRAELAGNDAMREELHIRLASPDDWSRGVRDGRYAGTAAGTATNDIPAEQEHYAGGAGNG